ncbi:hypothetical protein TNCV_4418961 [Trichonephila clavipes]|nr:hypothetical protein TNCV_4418961 [Trichonephila clavipes]
MLPFEKRSYVMSGMGCTIITTSRNDKGDRGNLMVKVTDSWSACYEFEPRIVDDLPYRGVMHVISADVQMSFRWCGS